MSLNKPFYRTIRPFIGQSYETSHENYLMHPANCDDPNYYIRQFLLIQKDLLNLFNYIEPCDDNMEFYSLRSNEILNRSCIEIEQNFRDILLANGIKESHFTYKDFYQIKKSHFLNLYSVKIDNISEEFFPFANWTEDKGLDWKNSFNRLKHNRKGNLKSANLRNTLNAVLGLLIVLKSQFYKHDPQRKGFSLEDMYMLPDIGGYFEVKLNDKEISSKDRYEFAWNDLMANTKPETSDMFCQHDYKK
jgi:hypothetical protein